MIGSASDEYVASSSEPSLSYIYTSLFTFFLLFRLVHLERTNPSLPALSHRQSFSRQLLETVLLHVSFRYSTFYFYSVAL